MILGLPPAALLHVLSRSHHGFDYWGNIAPPTLSFFVASIWSGWQLVTSRYPRTHFLLWKWNRCWSLYGYILIFGAVAAVSTTFSNVLLSSGAIRLEGLGVDQPWLRAIYLGIAVKLILPGDVYRMGDEHITFGAVARLFIPVLLRNIDLDEDHWVKVYLDPFVKRYDDLDTMRQKVIEEIPECLPELESKAFELTIRQATSTRYAMRITLKILGKRAFERIFPPD